MPAGRRLTPRTSSPGPSTYWPTCCSAARRSSPIEAQAKRRASLSRSNTRRRSMLGWNVLAPQIEPVQREQIINEVTQTFKGRPLAELRQDHEKLFQNTLPLVRAVVQRMALQAGEPE